MHAREFLSRRGIEYDNRYVDEAPLPREVAMQLAASARRLLVKAGAEILTFDEQRPITPAEIDAYLVHADGYVNVPVLVMGDLLVRGYTEALYRRALGDLADPSAP